MEMMAAERALPPVSSRRNAERAFQAHGRVWGEGGLVHWNLSVGVHVPFAQEEEERFISEVRVDLREGLACLPPLLLR